MSAALILRTTRLLLRIPLPSRSSISSHTLPSFLVPSAPGASTRSGCRASALPSCFLAQTLCYHSLPSFAPSSPRARGRPLVWDPLFPSFPLSYAAPGAGRSMARRRRRRNRAALGLYTFALESGLVDSEGGRVNSAVPSTPRGWVPLSGPRPPIIRGWSLRLSL